jgi:hypothetical protein
MVNGILLESKPELHGPGQYEPTNVTTRSRYSVPNALLQKRLRQPFQYDAENRRRRSGKSEVNGVRRVAFH